MERAEITTRTILRVIACIVLAAAVLALLWTLRKPIGWVLLAGFIAIALSAPVNTLVRRGLPRGLAIAAVYFTLLLIPAGLAAIVVPPIVEQGTQLAENAPTYARDAEDFVQDNKRLRELNEKYDLTEEIQNQANQLPQKIGDAASVLGNIGLGVVNSIFALVNILILSVFLLAGGRGWIDGLIAFRPEPERARLRRIVDHVGDAVSGYVRGALTIAVIAGVQTYVVLTILGVPFRGPLAVVAGFASLVPLVGATIAAVLIGVITLFTNFPVATIVWVIWAIVYQQLENNVIQPQVQRRAVQVHPLLVLIGVLFGATLLGVVGALVAIPATASLQIILREYLEYRREVYGRVAHEDLPGDDSSPPPPEDPPATAARRTLRRLRHKPPPGPSQPEGGAA